MVVLRILLVFLICTLGVNANADTLKLPVFPGAEGFGMYTSGGRAGIVCKVTNLNDSGSGSLRDCTDNPKSRIIIFTIGGVIRLESNLTISHPYMSIFGQTAPGDGIVITGKPAIKQALVTIATHDISIQHLRFRTSLGGEPECCSYPLTIASSDNHDQLTNIILDHCSFSGGTTGIIACLNNTDNITISHSIIGPGLQHDTEKDIDHNQGVVFSSPGIHSLSLHHNLIIHSQGNNPSINTGAGVVDIVNNLIYNWGKNGTDITSKHGNIQANLVHNLYIMGKDSSRDAPELTARNANKHYQIFPEENLSIRDPEQPEPLPINFSLLGWPTPDWEANKRFPAPGITTFKSPTLLEKVLPTVGAILPSRDATDRHAIEDVKTQQGTIPPCPTPPECPVNSAFPSAYANGSPEPDKDDDGIPDAWEQANTLNPDKPDATEDRNVNGYTNIEEWIFSLTPTTTLAQHAQKTKAAN